MKREMFFAVLGITAMLFGLGFLLAPEMSLSLYGVPQEPHNVLLMRYFGSALFGLGLAVFLARETQDPAAIRALLIAPLISNLAGAWLSASTAGTLQNGMAWTSVAIYLAFAAGAGYFLFLGRSTVGMQTSA